MNIICSDTNAVVGGISVPVGAYEWPEAGSLVIVTSSGYSNTLTVGSSDTVMIDRVSVTVSAGPDVLLWFILGLSVTLGSGVIMGFGRWLLRSLAGLGRIEF